jgi:hypothetical protein
LHLKLNKNITDEGLKNIKGVKELDLTRNMNITNKGI